MTDSKQTSFEKLADMFEQLESTSSSLEMIDILASFLPKLSPEEGRAAAHFVRGEVAPPYDDLEIGLAEKLVMRAIAGAVDEKVEKIERMYNKAGDLGNVAEELLSDSKTKGHSIIDIFQRMVEIAEMSGTGSQDRKINALTEMLKGSTPREAKYVIRLVLGTLRLGVAEMTFLNGLSKALTGEKKHKPILEHSFNMLSDLGEVTYRALKDGLEPLKKSKPEVCKPIRMMASQRVSTVEEAMEKIGDTVHVEYKYDGERLQIHLDSKGDIRVFSRRLEDITYQFPDALEAFRKSFKGKEVIVEGEVVAIDTETHKLKDFQTLMQRRRKHDIEAYIKKVPVALFVFDVLYVDGTSLLDEPLSVRREKMEEYFTERENEIYTALYIEANDTATVESFFAEALSWGAEGVMIKDAESTYRAGSRGWQWIKFKRDYQSDLVDSFDLVAVGAFHGTGRRAGAYGSLLAAAFDPQSGEYHSFTKVGAGFTDEDLDEIPKMLKRYKLKEKHKLVVTDMKADVWFEPALVMELTGAEITVSPTHAVSKGKLKKKGGLALRFPRFIKWRDDKSPEQATTDGEILEIYKQSNA